MEVFQIAIDGPAGAGKSSVAKRIAGELGIPYIDTGAMYRCIALQCLEDKISTEDEGSIAKIVENAKIEFHVIDGQLCVFLHGKEVTQAIRTPEVTELVSVISALQVVRTHLVTLQQSIAKRTQRMIMDGRDIGTSVLPDAKVKIFLTANLQERARRRYQEMVDKGFMLHLDDVTHDLALRDEIDQNREISPLRPANDAIIIDSSNLCFEEVIVMILALCHHRFLHQDGR